jgi:hypothetical protein
VTLEGKKLAAATSVTVVLALGTAAAATAAHAVPTAAVVSHAVAQDRPPQLSVKGLEACAGRHHLLKAYLGFGLHYGFDKYILDLALKTLPPAAEILFVRDAVEFGTKFFDFYYDCVAPYISPKAIILANGWIVLPGFSFNPSPSVSSTPNPSPTMTTSPSSGTLGDTFTISGQHWAPGGTLSITLPYGSKGWFVGGPWTFTVPANGSWEVSATVSQQATPGSTLTSPPGVYVFTATENNVNKTADYTVLPTSSPTGNPTTSSPTGGPTFVCVTGPGGTCSPSA